MKLLIILLLISSCSMFKTRAGRCFDALEDNGTVNMVIMEKGQEIFFCGPKNINQGNYQ
jgi:hypothetical protein